jgi:hypothetical protein
MRTDFVAFSRTSSPELYSLNYLPFEQSKEFSWLIMLLFTLLRLQHPSGINISIRNKKAYGPFQTKRIEKFGVILNVLEKCFPLNHELAYFVLISHL